MDNPFVGSVNLNVDWYGLGSVIQSAISNSYANKSTQQEVRIIQDSFNKFEEIETIRKTIETLQNGMDKEVVKDALTNKDNSQREALRQAYKLLATELSKLNGTSLIDTADLNKKIK